MNKKKTAPIVMTAMVVLALALAAFAMPVSASGNPGAGCPSETKYHDTIRGGVYFEHDTSNPDKPKTMVFNNVPDGIKLAKVYFGIWQGSPGKGGNFTFDIVNATGTYNSPVYRSCDPCPGEPCGIYPNAYQNDDTRCNHLFWEGNPPGTPPHNKPPNVPSDNIRGYITGCGVQFISFNATPYITPGTNTVTVTPELCSYPSCPCYNSGWDRRVYTIALLVVFGDEDMSEITYWINEGAPYMEENSYCDGGDNHPDASFWLNGTSMIANPTGATYEVLGWPHVFSACGDPRYTKLNSNDIGCPDYTGYAGGWDVYVRYDNVLDNTTLQNNNFVDYHAPSAYYMRGNVAVLVASSGGKDLTVSDIDFPKVMRPYTDHTIEATRTNLGGESTGPFNVSLYVDDVLNGTKPVSAGLGGGASTPVDFIVNLPSDCYEFKVVADCYDEVAESNENNNETSEYYQVGTVIVVESNADLIAEADRVVGGTYYIEDRTITNCAGCGITIENTDLPFVISNSRVHDCGDNAVFMHNVVNGGVKNSTLKDNNPSGIRLEKCSYVDIANNTVQNNGIYGIDVYMEAMPTVDCDHINITCNTVTGNQYGLEVLCDDCIVRDNNIRSNTHPDYAMYMFGNNSKVYNNTIEDNAGYGLKLLHSATHPCLGNYIYWNDFINNKGGATPQAYDSGTTNTWNTATQGSYCYNGGIYTNYMGNYWDDHTSPDSDGDGIVDDPYALDGGTGATDSYPLMVPWRLCGDVNRDSLIHMGDALAVRNHWGFSFSLCNPWAGDVNCDGLVHMGDALAIRNYWGSGFPLGECCKDCGLN